MDRLTPRMRRTGEITALSLIIIISAATSILLTFLSCYATICSEEYFPTETRIHIIVYYGFIILVGLTLLLRQYSPGVRSLMGFHLLNPLPLVGKRVTFGGLLFFISVLAVVGGPTVQWWPAQQEFWGSRADPLGWASAKLLLTITGVTGHYADTLLGLLLIPVSRNSLIGHAFSIHQSSLLFSHKMVSCLFAIFATAHGVSYIVSLSCRPKSYHSAVLMVTDNRLDLRHRRKQRGRRRERRSLRHRQPGHDPLGEQDP